MSILQFAHLACFVSKVFDPTAENPVRDRRIGSRRAVLKDSPESAPPAERSLGAESRQLAEMLIPERDKREGQWNRVWEEFRLALHRYRSFFGSQSALRNEKELSCRSRFIL